MKRIYLSLLLSAYLFSAKFALAGRFIDDTGEARDQTRAFLKEARYAPGDVNSLPYYISVIISVFLGLMGIIFLILIIIAGFNWMIAAGNDEKVASAKKTLSRAVIGLFIVVAAYVITYFVFLALDSVSGPPAP